MNKRLQTTVIVVAIVVISLLSGLVLDFIFDKVDELRYPRKYSETVEKYASQYDVPESVIYAMIRTESDFKPDAVSGAGAIGLMQIMPDTFEWLQEMLGEHLDAGMLYDPDTNIRYGTYYLKYLYERYGIWETVFAAYNAGIGNVNEWLRDPEHSTEYGELKNIPFAETRKHVKKVSKANNKYINLYY